MYLNLNYCSLDSGRGEGGEPSQTLAEEQKRVGQFAGRLLQDVSDVVDLEDGRLGLVAELEHLLHVLGVGRAGAADQHHVLIDFGKSKIENREKNLGNE